MCSSGDWGCSPTSSFAAGRAIKKVRCAHGPPACDYYPEFVIKWKSDEIIGVSYKKGKKMFKRGQRRDLIAKQFRKYWLNSTNGWECKERRIANKKNFTILEDLASHLGLYGFELVEKLLTTDFGGDLTISLLIEKIPELNNVSNKKLEVILFLSGYKKKSSSELYYLDGNRKKTILNVCAATKVFSEQKQLDYSVIEKVNYKKQQRIDDKINRLYEKRKRINLKHAGNAFYVDPANGERHGFIIRIIYPLIFLAIITCVSFIFLRSSIQLSNMAKEGKVSFVDLSAFYGVIIGSVVTGLVTAFTTFLMIQREYKVDYHHERVEALPVFTILKVRNSKQYFDEHGKYLGNDERLYVKCSFGAIEENPLVIRMKNSGKGIALEVTIDNADEDFLGDFDVREEKLVYFPYNFAEKFFMNIKFRDIYDNIYTQRFELYNMGEETLVRNYSPMLVMRTSRVRYQQ